MRRPPRSPRPLIEATPNTTFSSADEDKERLRYSVTIEASSQKVLSLVIQPPQYQQQQVAFPICLFIFWPLASSRPHSSFNGKYRAANVSHIFLNVLTNWIITPGNYHDNSFLFTLLFSFSVTCQNASLDQKATFNSHQ